MCRLISCEFNMDAACVKLKFVNDSMLAVENEVADNMYQYLESDYLTFNVPIAYADMIPDGDCETHLRTVTKYKPLDN